MICRMIALAMDAGGGGGGVIIFWRGFGRNSISGGHIAILSGLQFSPQT